MRGALLRRGLSEKHASYVVEGLIQASLRGIDTHGVRLFPTYLTELDGGRAHARPEIRWRRSAPAVRSMDAGGALGLVAGRLATAEVVRLARLHGTGVVAVSNSNHFGAASYYTLELARSGLVGFCCSNSDALVAPFNGLRPFFGTNPLSLAAPGSSGEFFCADFATSQVSYSKVKRRMEEGEPVEPGWAVAPDGCDVADAGGELSALKPLGGYKGQGLAMSVEILCALLTGEPADHELSHFYSPPFDTPRRVSHLFWGLELSSFTDPGGFQARVRSLLARVRSEPAAGASPLLAPGDLEAETEARRTREGIPLLAREVRWFDRLEHDVESRSEDGPSEA